MPRYRFDAFRCVAPRSTMSKAAAITSSSGSAPNMMDGHATTPVSIDNVPLESVSCTTSTFCVAVDNGGEEFTYNGRAHT